LVAPGFGERASRLLFESVPRAARRRAIDL
jgi:hypothetical protein